MNNVDGQAYLYFWLAVEVCLMYNVAYFYTMKYENDSPHGWHSKGGRGGIGVPVSSQYSPSPSPSLFQCLPCSQFAKLFLVRQFILGIRNEFVNS